MNVAEWILVSILSITLLIFLIFGILLLKALISVAKEAEKVVIKSQDLADSATDVVENVKGMTSIGGIVQTFSENFIEPKLTKKGSKNGRGKKD